MKRFRNPARTLLSLLIIGLLALPLVGCDGDDGDDGRDGSSATLFDINSITPPSGPAGQFTIDTSGGTGGAGSGADGGDLELYMDYGTLGGHIKIFKTGLADASFTFPSTVTTYLGLNPLAITADTTIAVVTTEPAADTPYMVAGNQNIYISDGNATLADEDPVTGISVAAGTTLTLESNYSNLAQISLQNDVRNAGTLTTTAIAVAPALNAGESRASLFIKCDVYYGASGSAIDLTGANDTEGPGGNGGNLSLNIYDSDWSITQDAGSFFNQGTINTSGGNGTDGGNAGYINIYANLLSYNTGDLTAMGGTGSTGNGGNGAYVEIDTDYGNNYNSGDLNGSGGDGVTAGGSAGYIYLYIGYPGHIKNSGDLTSNGGDGAIGGSADGVEFGVYGGDIINSGDLSAVGGEGGSESGEYGGSGGYVDVWAYYDYGWEGYYQPIGDMEFSGNMDVSGGNGYDGGDGGWIEFYLDADYVPASQEIILYGYLNIDTSGGDGTTGAGSGGNIYAENSYAYGVFDNGYGPSGGVINYADIDASGGTATNGSGGYGGDLYMETEYDYGYMTTGEIVYNAGDLDLSGGDGTTGAGSGGYVWLWGYNHAENTGDIDASGGDASGDSAYAGDGADNDGIYILSDLGAAINSGNMTAAGGNAPGQTAYAGDGRQIEIVGYSASNSGALSAAGGDANTTNGTGGDANVVFIYGIFDGTTNTASAIDVSAGAGATAGAPGEIFVGGMNVTDNF